MGIVNNKECNVLTPLTERQKTVIVNNVVRACSDIHKLNRQGYKFVHNASGFIAHYDLHGFIATYEDRNLRQEIKANARMNMWDNFRPGDRDYEYMMAKKDVYQRILAQI
jgi:hypothetical protein